MLAVDLVTNAVDPLVLVASSGFLTLDNPEPEGSVNRELPARCYSICLLPSRDLDQAADIIVTRQLARFCAARQRRMRSSADATANMPYPAT